MKTLREYINIVDGKVEESATAPIIVPKRRAKVKEPTKFDIPFSADDYVPPALELASAEALDRIIADPSTRETTRELAKKARAEKKKGVAEGNDIASAEVLLKRYELLTQSIRNAIDQRDYNEKFKHIEQIRDALEKHYGIDPDKMNEQGVAEGENQEYTVRVVDEEGSGYTVKVTATSEQGALHKAIVKVRNSGARPEHARIIRQDVEEQATPEAIARIERLSSK